MKTQKLASIGKGTWKVMKWLSGAFDVVKWLFIIFGLLWAYAVFSVTAGLIESFSVLSLIWGIICLSFLTATCYFGVVLWRVTALVRAGKNLVDRADNIVGVAKAVDDHVLSGNTQSYVKNKTGNDHAPIDLDLTQSDPTNKKIEE